MSYDENLVTVRDKVRLLIGDNSATEHFQDTELDFFVSENGDRPYAAAAAALETWAAQMASRPTSYMRGGIQVSRSPGELRTMADMLRARDNVAGGDFEQLTEIAYDETTLNQILADRALTES